MEDNKIIAEFMEVLHQGIFPPVTIGERMYTLDELQYHTSWDWLMPVVEKISDIKSWSINATLDWLSESQERDGLYNISDINKSVVEFINKLQQ